MVLPDPQGRQAAAGKRKHRESWVPPPTVIHVKGLCSQAEWMALERVWSNSEAQGSPIASSRKVVQEYPSIRLAKNSFEFFHYISRKNLKKLFGHLSTFPPSLSLSAHGAKTRVAPVSRCVNEAPPANLIHQQGPQRTAVRRKAFRMEPGQAQANSHHD